MPWLYYLLSVVVKTLLFLLTSWEVRGRENVPREGAVVVVANHLNLADPPVLGASLGRRVVFMAKKELFQSRLSSYLIRSLGAFPVQRGGPVREALRQANQVLANGQVLVVFPEGRRSKNAQLQPAFPGSALIALHNGVPVLPVGITGTEKIKGAAWFLRRPKITVNIGRPFSLSPVSNNLTKAELAELTHFVMERIAELLPPEYRGSYCQTRAVK